MRILEHAWLTLRVVHKNSTTTFSRFRLIFHGRKPTSAQLLQRVHSETTDTAGRRPSRKVLADLPSSTCIRLIYRDQLDVALSLADDAGAVCVRAVNGPDVPFLSAANLHGAMGHQREFPASWRELENHHGISDIQVFKTRSQN